MKLTTKGRYAVTAMLDVALHQHQGKVSLGEIANRQTISHCYLEQLFAKLCRCGLLTSSRGPEGGYLLAMPSNKIAIADIIEAINDKIDATRCLGAKDCQNGLSCLTHQLWAELSEIISNFLHSMTLADLMNKKEIQTTAKRQNKQQAMATSLHKSHHNSFLRQY